MADINIVVPIAEEDLPTLRKIVDDFNLELENVYVKTPKRKVSIPLLMLLKRTLEALDKQDGR